MGDEPDFAGMKCRPVRQIGKGGMAVVYEAVEEATGAHCALKVFTASGERSGFLRKRFIAEGRLLSRLDHPNLVRVRGWGAGAGRGDAYIVMDLVLGADGRPHTLSDLHAAQEIDEERLFGWYGDLSAALKYIHGRGIVHRDVKPSNVLIDRDGRAILADFGVSRFSDEDLRKSLSVEPTMVTDASTLSKVVLGTANYLAPEVRRGEPANPASDMYSLGVTLFRLLTGVWYEPDSNAMNILELYDPAWRGVFEALLAADPAKRSLPAPRRRAHAAARRIAVALGCAAALAVAAVACFYAMPRLEVGTQPGAAASAVSPQPKPQPEMLYDETLGPYDAESAATVETLKATRIEMFELDESDDTDVVCSDLVRKYAPMTGLNMLFHGGQTKFAASPIAFNTRLFDVLEMVTRSVKNSAGTWWVEKGVVHVCAFPVMEERIYEIEMDAAAREFFAGDYLKRLGDNYEIYYSTSSTASKLSRLEYHEADGKGVLAVRDWRRDIEKVLRVLSDNGLRFRYARRKVFLELPE